jgi:hypothetical protein
MIACFVFFPALHHIPCWELFGAYWRMTGCSSDFLVLGTRAVIDTMGCGLYIDGVIGTMGTANKRCAYIVMT